MKKTIFLTLFVATQTLHAQTEFAPIGAEWIYDYPGITCNYTEHYVKYKSEKDTLINGKTCKYISSSATFNYNSNEILYEEDNKVYYLFDDDFKLIYDFGAGIGDTVHFDFKTHTGTLPFDDWDTTNKVNCLVTDIDTVTIDGMNLRKFHTIILSVDSVDDSWLIGSEYDYLERIGHQSEFIMHMGIAVCMNYPYLRCYSDGEIAYISDWWENFNLDCEHSLYSPIEFAPIGAKWYYSEPYDLYSPLPTEHNFILFSVTGDTIINEMNSKIIELSYNGTSPLCTEFIAQTDDTIFYYNNASQQFHILYNFDANIGDTIIVHQQPYKPNCGALYDLNDSVANFIYKIANIDSIFVYGKWLKRQTVEKINYDDYWSFSMENGQPAYIIEGIGSMMYYFGRANVTFPEMTIPMLRCYSDQHKTYINPNWNHACDYYYETDLIADAGNDTSLCVTFGLDTFYLGGSPTVTGGIPPYTYIWSTNYSINAVHYPASVFLNDTTSANPLLEFVPGLGEEITFYLTVFDNSGNISSDSILISICGYIMQSNMTFEINKGDSVQISPFAYGVCLPLQYLWSPDVNISDIHSEHPLVWPDNDISYSVTITDSTGCEFYNHCDVSVNMTGFDVVKETISDIFLYPNPTNDLVRIKNVNNLAISSIQIYNTMNQLVLERNNNLSEIDISALQTGIYFLKIFFEKNKSKTFKIAKL